MSICSAICAEGSRWWETGQTRSLTARRTGLVNRHFAQNYYAVFVQYAQILKCQVADCTNFDRYFCVLKKGLSEDSPNFRSVKA